MNQEFKNLPQFPEFQPASEVVPAEVSQAEETLRQLARLEPPIGAAERVHYRLQEAQNAPQRKSIWATWMPVRRMQYAGAAILAVAVGASSWGVYHARHSFGSQPANPTLHGTPSGGFGAAGAERHPGSLKPINVPPVHKKKPSPGRVKPDARAAQPTSDPVATPSNSAGSSSSSDAPVDEPKR